MSAINVQPINEREVWESFCLAQPMPQFMQSWDAGLLAQDMGEEILRLGLYDKECLEGVCLLSVVRAKRGTFLFAPYGPVFTQWKPEYLEAMTGYLKALGAKLGADFIRLSPFLERTESHLSLFKDAGYRVSPIHMLAEHVWLLELEGKSEQQLLADMSKTTRYSIKRAEKDGVTVHTNAEQAMETFLRLHSTTKERHQFTAYPDKLFRHQVERFSDSNHVTIFTATHNNQALASAIIMYYGTQASYHHGASTPSKVPAAYALQWAAILEAKRRGCRFYNFWGVTDMADKKHPFYGISLFKTRFGGKSFTLIPCQDLPLTPKYQLTRLIESLRRVRRGFGWKRA
jgi:lipid II:glycine glycyltransferase (peptidoglycan interpeptide bridge formation enzyme)